VRYKTTTSADLDATEPSQQETFVFLPLMAPSVIASATTRHPDCHACHDLRAPLFPNSPRPSTIDNPFYQVPGVMTIAAFSLRPGNRGASRTTDALLSINGRVLYQVPQAAETSVC
jgi:hypothetical protein